MPPRHIAVLGGGLTGLSSAFHLSRRFPNSRITLLEKAPRLGGWVRSERIEVQDAEGRRGKVLLEAGPRTLRPNSKSILELINLLNLQGSLLTIPKSSPLAKNRFLHVAPHPGLLPIPSSLASIFSSPLSPLLVNAVLREPFRRANRPLGSADESFESFLERRFGGRFARTFGSAMVHGIYAADARKLSVRAAFPALWDAEERGRGSVVRGFVRRTNMNNGEGDVYDTADVESMMEGVSVYAFKNGIETLTDALVRHLRARGNVELVTGTAVESLRREPGTQFEVLTTSIPTFNPTHVVSTLPLPILDALLPATHRVPHLTANPSSSVTVINLVFPTLPPGQPPLHPPGFGYLIPRPENDYSHDTPGILGVVFDSSAQDEGEFGFAVTKMTVMLGGPHPLTAEHTSTQTVLTHLAQQLQRPVPEPLLYRVHHQKNCIPTPTVGHLERMRQLKATLAGDVWEGKLEVVGAGVGGVSVGDCIEAGRHVGRAWS